MEEWIAKRLKMYKDYVAELESRTRITYENEQKKTEIWSKIHLLEELEELKEVIESS